MTEGVIRLQNQCLPGCLVTKFWKPCLLPMPEKHPPHHMSQCIHQDFPFVFLLSELLFGCSRLSTIVSSDTSSGKNSSRKYDTQGHPHTRFSAWSSVLFASFSPLGLHLPHKMCLRIAYQRLWTKCRRVSEYRNIRHRSYSVS